MTFARSRRLPLDAPEGASENALGELIAADEVASVRAVLAALPRETLKSACKTHSLPADSGGAPQ